MGEFVTAARVQTMLRDFNRLRKAVRGDNWPDAQAALDKCERWFDQISPNAVSKREALQARIERLEWQPIKTAPRDGTLVDLWVVGTHSWATPTRFEDMRFIDGEWWGARRFMDGDKPTHWMHRPGPPRAALSEEGE